jgi:hypothetical protein
MFIILTLTLNMREQGSPQYERYAEDWREESPHDGMCRRFPLVTSSQKEAHNPLYMN